MTSITSTTSTPTAPTRAETVLERLAAAIEARDASTIAALYSPDATLRIHDRDHPPAAPNRYVGAADIEAYYRDVCGRDMNHRVTDRVAVDDRIAFVQRCRYPEGQQVLCIVVATVDRGLITDETAMQVWDD